MKPKTKKSKSGQMTSREAVEYYDREARKYDIKAMCAPTKYKANIFKRVAARFRRQRDAISHLCGLDIKQRGLTRIETCMLNETGERRIHEII